jgi:hypothetical protein
MDKAIGSFFSAFLLCFVAGEANAQFVRLQCSDNSSGSGNSVLFTSTLTDINLVKTPELTQQYLSATARAALEQCRSSGQASRVDRFYARVNLADPAYPNDRGSQVISARVETSGGAWMITDYTAVGIIARQQQRERSQREQTEAAEKQARELQAAKIVSQKLQSDFKTQNGVEAWVNPQTLKANPFPYKGKIVGMRLDFQQMTGDGEAIFGSNFDVLASGVPNTAFTRPGTQVMLALRVDGIKQVRLLGTDMAVPFGSYKGAYFCTMQNCSEFFGPQ